ncbi:MAG: non-homologous end joining protein Ku [Acidiferrobacteraceae bacterium]
MPRSQGSGSRAFILVSIPLKRFRAVSLKSARLRLLHDAERGRVWQKPVCVLDGAGVPAQHLGRGYEIDADQYATLSDDERERPAPAAPRPIDTQEFVRVAEIDPPYFDQNRLLAPDPIAKRPSALVVRAMQTAGRIGFGRIVTGTKQCHTVLRPKNLAPMRATVFHPDEIVPETTLPDRSTADIAPGTRAPAMAGERIASLAGDFARQKYHDEYRAPLRRLIQEKATGATSPRPVSFAEQLNVVNLMDALAASTVRTRHRATPARPPQHRRA